MNIQIIHIEHIMSGTLKDPSALWPLELRVHFIPATDLWL